MNCDSEKICIEIDKHYDHLIGEEDGEFGGWAWHIWDFIICFYKLDTYEEYKAAFLCTLKRLLDDGRVKLIRPGVDVLSVNGEPPTSGLTINDLDTHWDAPSDEIIAWIQERWPKDVRDINDIELTNFFYSVVPPLAWKGEDGMWY